MEAYKEGTLQLDGAVIQAGGVHDRVDVIGLILENDSASLATSVEGSFDGGSTVTTVDSRLNRACLGGADVDRRGRDRN